MSLYTSINPYSGITLKSYPDRSDEEIVQHLLRAHEAQQKWKTLSFHERSKPILKLAELIREQADSLALLATHEMGKPVKEARAEILKCITACTYYAGNAERILKPDTSISDNQKSVTTIYEPMGVILGIFPWNFPYWQIIRSAIPTVMAGNTILIKPAPNTPQTAMALQHLFHEAGFPADVLQTVLASHDQVSMLIRHKYITACTLTGSEQAGATIASQAALQIKKSVLELGGSDPFIVMQDADLTLAADTAITARFQNNGQSCIASKRFLLHHTIADQFLELFIARIAQLKLGDPADESVQIGPLARKDLLYKLKEQVDQTVIAGAKIIYQHPAEPPKGFFFPPTVITDIPAHAPAYKEELFGPVVSAFTFHDEEEAIHLANDTSFGLGASVWSKDLATGERVAQALACGQVFINGLVKSNAHYPFGGVKRSGFGRELGEWGLKEFCSVKTIWH